MYDNQIGYLQALAPELVVTVFGLLCLATGFIRDRGRSDLARPLALLGLLAGLAVTIWQGPIEGSVAEITVDRLTWYVRLALCGVGLLVVLSAWTLPATGRIPEMFSLMLFSIVGGMVTAASNDLVLLFFALELVSVPTYAMVAGGTDNSASQEAGFKYFFLGALSSAIMVYGFSFIYGAAETTRLTAVAGPVGAGVEMTLRTSPIAWLGILLALFGLAYKIAAVPMHFYLADVYQGAAAPISGMLSYVPKFAGLVAVAKILYLLGWPLQSSFFWFIWIMAAVTMTVGNTLALLQDNVKRMLAYSSVAHSGYMLIGLLVGAGGAEAGLLEDGIGAMLFYIVAYGIMNIGAFAVIGYLSRDGREPQLLHDIAGMGRTRPGAALVLAICVFSLLGMPPTIGFFGKVLLFGSTLSLSQGLLPPYNIATVALVILALLNTAVSAGYYLRIIGACYIRSPEGPVAWPRGSAPVAVGLMACAVLVVMLGLLPGRLAGVAGQASAPLAAKPLRTLPAPVPTLPVNAAAGARDAVAPTANR